MAGQGDAEAEKAQILGRGGQDTFSEDSNLLGKAGASSCGGTSVEISASLLQATVLAMKV